jgi:hypothetical protein
MLIPCVQCGHREYTEESPLWFHCDKCLKPKVYYCTGCGYDFHKSHYLSTSKKREGSYCERCLKVLTDKVMYYCDGCGEDYPRTHLNYVGVWDGYFCDRCNQPEEEII